MSHGIKLFPTKPDHRFISSNDGWTAEGGAAIYSDADSIAAQNELHLLSGTTLAGAVSPVVTLVGSETPVRAELLYKTNDSSQTMNVSILDQGGTVIASTDFGTSAYSTTYNDYRRAVVDVDAPTGVTGVQVRVCQANDIDAEILINQAALNENVLLLDPDTIQRNPAVARAEHVTLSGRRVVDDLHRHYVMTYGWNAMEAPVYDRIQAQFYRNESLWLDDGDVPANQEVHATYTKGRIDHTNIESMHADAELWVQTVIDSLLPNDSGWGTSNITSWANAKITNLGSSTGGNFSTSLNSAYTYALFNLPTVNSSIGPYNYAQTLSVDVLTEIRSTAPGPFGFDVWVKDAMATLWRKVGLVARTGETNVVIDMRSTDMINQFTDATSASAPVQVLFRARSTNRVPGATVTFKNFHWLGNHAFDRTDPDAATMGTFGSHVIELADQPKAISYVQLDSTETSDVRAATTLTAGADYMMTQDGVALALPSPNADATHYNAAKALIRYTRDFRVVIDTLPDVFLRTGKTTAHDRQASMQLHTIRASREDQLG